MAAQRLTTARLIQIIVMLLILITAFLWRTWEHNQSRVIQCHELPCIFEFQDTRYTLKSDDFGLVLEGEAHNPSISISGVRYEKRAADEWILQPGDKSSAVHITLTSNKKDDSAEIIWPGSE